VRSTGPPPEDSSASAEAKSKETSNGTPARGRREEPDPTGASASPLGDSSPAGSVPSTGPTRDTGPPVVILEQDGNLRVTDAQYPGLEAAAQQVVGRTPAELLDRPSEVHRVARFQRRVLADGQPARRVFSIQVDGSVRRIALSVDPVVEGDDQIRLRSVAVDLTDDRRRETSLRQATQRAEVSRAVAERARRTEERAREQAEEVRAETVRKQQRRSDVLVGVAHDLRSPLSVIDGYVELLRRTLTDAPEEQLESILEAVDQLRSLVRSLTELVRFETGMAGVDLDTIDLRSVVQNAVEALGHRARERDFTLQMECPEEPVPARVDPDGLRRILNNVVGNALQSCTSVDTVRVQLSVDSRNGAFVEVSDTGPGISLEDPHAVFESFRRGHGDEEGTGLGLAVARRLAEAMGGTLRLTNLDASGTTFTARFPGGDGR